VTSVGIHAVLAELPGPDRLRALSKAMAMLDIILCPDDVFEDRYFRFKPVGVELASEGVSGWLRARTGGCNSTYGPRCHVSDHGAKG